ncbi:MAG: ABA4-like family protein [Nannocystales bacterium]
MDNEQIFSVCGVVAMIGWGLLILAPRWQLGTRWVAPVVLPLLIAVVYTVLVLTSTGTAPEGAGFGTLHAVGLLFSDERALLAGWIHYLAFDLVVGAWQLRDAQRLKIHHLLVIPCLVTTFMLGPAGLLMYWTLRTIHQRVVAPRD